MVMAVSCHVSCRPSTCPPWLQAALAEIEQKIQSLSLAPPPPPANSATADTFAERAENYYQKRPQLISLIQDLHNRYLHLADRYSQSLLKLNHHQSELSDDDDDRPPLSSISTFSDADADSSVSLFQPDSAAFDPLVVELTMSVVEREMLLDEISQSEARKADWSKKIELQRSLLEVMESERVVLVAENARLEYRAAAAAEERNAAALEVGYLRRKAGELAKCVAMMRDDHRVCLLGRRIEGLQKVVRGMERREREWREAVVRREREVREEMERMREENRRLRLRRRRRGWWWVGGKGRKGVGEGGCLWLNPCFCL